MSIKVLYVEDEIFLGKIVKETLEIRGFEVVMETDGANVVRVFEDVQPDICILDVMLPNRNGFELAEDIRKLNEDMPFIFLTAKTQTEDVVRGFKLGGNDYIRKPFSMEELIVRIENVLRVKQSTQITINSDSLAIGRYQFHLNRQVLAIGSKDKKMSFREAELLKYLWQHRNDVIDRRELLNHIWGNDSFFNSRNLDVYITKLRSYLKDDTAVEILTIKGVGYRFVIS
ncbi:MAG: response regulator transcription factor [Chitinophagaceae bacterium]|jgi:DNA-binding response OmpR family regulator|nr:response regulator transcription factor [Cytophagales bacterium]MCA6466705.1 response regulator transcription factor [Chitinophagaceae bacterium]MCA6470968.1 response regulator transcription factor [Chitinophagaceae bacterium]MCA6472734.1 response regulator transcription factor [Chitinophagaceae bacterium]MCA6475560.1 response regulator transcription factor [Chitinophagaceae bacterium]